MSVITRYEIKNIFSHLEDNVKILKSLNDSLPFQIIIYDSIKLLLSMSQKIKNKNNLYGKNMPIELLANVISFLPYEYKSICRYVCTTWLKNLNSDLSKKILFPILKNITFSESFNLGFVPRAMFKIGNNIYISNTSNAYKFNMENSELIKIDNENLQSDVICSNEKYICTSTNFEINIFSLDMKLITCIKKKKVYDVDISNNGTIFASSCQNLNIYNLEGKLLKSCDLINNFDKTSKNRELFLYRNEIYMVDTSFNRICVFSHEGELIRSWGNLGSEPGNFTHPWGIAIDKNIIFITDYGNRRIQAFTCYGQFIYEYKYDISLDYSNIIIANDYIYLTGWNSTNLTRLKLIYN
jgi:NHL repeat./F-box domain.